MKTSPVEMDLETLFHAYFKRLVYFSFQIVGHKETAEDLVQEVFLKLFQPKPDENAGMPAQPGYLYQAVKNASLNVLKHQKVEAKYQAQVAIPDVDEEYIISAITRAEVLAAVYGALETLPAGCKRISYLSFIEEKKNQEIAQELGISVTTVKSQKQRSLQLLRLRLNPEIFNFFFLIFLSQK